MYTINLYSAPMQEIAMQIMIADKNISSGRKTQTILR
jgi:hypothetical protein